VLLVKRVVELVLMMTKTRMTTNPEGSVSSVVPRGGGKELSVIFFWQRAVLEAS